MYIVFMSLLFLIMIIRIPKLHIISLKEGPAFAILICLIGMSLSLIWLFSQGAGNYFNLNIKKVYEFRFINKQIYRGIWGYLIFWGAKVFNPALIAWFLYKKKWSIVACLFIVQIVFFGLTSHKLLFAVGLGVLIIYFLLQVSWPSHIMLIGLIGIMCITAATFFLLNDTWLVALFVQRPLFKPSLLNFTYYDYFHSRDLVLLSNGILGKYISYPYEVNPPYLIGEYLKGFPPPRSNTGFLGTGYMHFGFPGVIIFALVVGMLFRIVDNLGDGKLPLWFSCSIVFGPFSSMITSGDLLPSLNTHGGLLSIFLLWLFRGSYHIEFSKFLFNKKCIKK